MSDSPAGDVLAVDRPPSPVAVHAAAPGGERTLHLQVPQTALPPVVARRYAVDDALTVTCDGVSVSLDATLELAPDAPPPPEHATAVAALRIASSALAAGDRRLLHLVWLAAVQHGAVDDDAVEPPAPAGLGHLGEDLEVVAEWLGLSGEMVEVAARRASRTGRRTAGRLLHDEAVLSWEHERDAHRARERRAQDWLRGVSEADSAWARSVVGADPRVAWQQVDAVVRLGRRREYVRAVTLLVELKAREGEAGHFDDRLRRLRERHAGRGVFLSTLDRAGLGQL